MLAHVLTMVNWFDEIIGSPQAHIEEVLALSREHGFAYYLGYGPGTSRTIIDLARTRPGRS